MAKAYSYLRFSTPEQRHGDSFRRQSTMAVDYALKHGLDLDERNYQDLGVSAFRGQNAEAGRLGEFMEAVKIGAIEAGSYLLVESLDRISRGIPRKAIRLLEDICEAGIVVVTLSDGRRYDTETLNEDHTAFIIAFMFAVRANEESASKSRRLKAAWENKQQNASTKPVTSICPQWMRRVGDTFELIPERAHVVRRIFELAASGTGQHSIAETLNREGVPVFGRGAMWHRSYVAKILANAATVGTYTPHELVIDRSGKKQRRPGVPVEGYFPSVVTVDLFATVNDARKGAFHARGPSASRSPTHALAGLARCPVCRSAMTRINKGPKGGNPYLICTKAKASAGCRRQHVPLLLIDETVCEDLNDLADSCPTVADAEGLSEVLLGLEAQRDKLLERGQDLLERSREESGSPIIRSALRELDASILGLDQRIEDTRIQLRDRNDRLISSRLEALREQGSDKNVEKINTALRRLLSAVIVDYRRGQLVFEWLHGGDTEVTYDGGLLLTHLEESGN